MTGLAPTELWWLDPSVTYLNHGSFGATPKCVLEAQDSWRRHLERQPVDFMTRELPSLIRQAATKLAESLSADPDGMVFVDNATTAVNTVLSTLQLCPGDRIVLGSLAYPAVRNAAEHYCQRAGATVHVVDLPLAVSAPDQLIAPFLQALSLKPRLVIVDHVISATAWVLPVERLIQQARQDGVPVLVDGAHMPGMLPLNLLSLDADWYTGNAHKWLFAPKGCAFLYTRDAHRHDTHPLVISNQYRQGYCREFDWMGTRDPAAWLAITAAIDFHHQLGGDRLMAYMRDLAWDGAGLIANLGGLTLPAPAACYGSMVSIPLDIPGDDVAALAMHDTLIDHYGIEVPVMAIQNRLWIRISAQAYNWRGQFELLAQSLLDLLISADKCTGNP